MLPVPVASPIKVFISYAHEDEHLLRRLEAQLSPIARNRLIEVWTDGEIVPGAKWRAEILHRLRTADIVLLLISDDFLNSSFAIEIELEEAMQRQEKGENTIIPVILRPCLGGARRSASFKPCPGQTPSRRVCGTNPSPFEE